MEWVETTGKTLEDAKDAALDQLGVDEAEAEFEVIDEAKGGLFGLTRREARVRARVRPTSPRPKVERRDRRRRGGAKTGTADAGEGASGGATRASESTPRKPRAKSTSTKADTAEPADQSAAAEKSEKSEPRRGGRRKSESTPPATIAENGATPEGNAMTTDDATVEDQAEIISEFLRGLVDAYGLTGEIEQERIDEETIELQVVGEDLGLLIGPKGQTLMAIQDLSRTVVQRQAAGTHHGRVRLDVGGYRQRRREALARFTQTVADEVKASGVQKAMEPMNAADRKVVHDTVNEIDGVRTVSEGEDQRRRVVILPDD
ncbi:MAG TPA: RNA-binding cell elongation regulator Jag/EloR [Acidimicrobiales bacterium]